MHDHQLISRVLPAKFNLARNQSLTLEKAEKLFGDIPKFFGNYKNTIGIEVEVENCDIEPKDWLYWGVKPDGSLKVKGAEFVSSPVGGYNIDYALHELRKTFDKQKDLLWSHRTSVHVHVDSRGFKIIDLVALVATYAVFEKLFFSMVAEHRRGNPYCYYLTDINPEDTSLGNPETKYCALNVGNCLLEYNTIEFRHMQGTQDFKALRRWIQLVVKLHHYIKTNDSEEILLKVTQLNSSSLYVEFLNEVFNTSAKHFIGYDFQKQMEEGVLWAKMYLLSRKGEL